ncbi:copper amine oxidase N-terminal domain-containing protein [Cohnella laeviribosi]|uniref:copper amine oxidase N-terminal domain-containing protein n=1 Tax=Cohnella laeviribosi TaxID=380174 RepID=UPI003D1ABAA5
MTKKTGCVLMILVLAFVMSASWAGAASPIKYGIPNINVLLDGKRIAFPDVWPQVDANQRVLVPIRVVSENLGAKVNYANNMITITQGSKVVVLTIGSKTATVNGKPVTFDSAAVVKNSRTLVPLRFVSEALGQTVEWDGTDKYVWIGKKEVPVLQDVVKKVQPLDDFKKYYGTQTFLIDDWHRDGVRIFKKEQFPLIIPDPYGVDSNIEIYNLWLDKYKDESVIKVHYRGPTFGMSFLTGDGVPRTRNGIELWRQKLNDGSQIDIFPLLDKWDNYQWKVKDWDKLHPSEIQYIHFKVDAGSYILLENPFK